MTNSMTADPASRRATRWGAPIGLVLLALLAMGNVVPNRFTRDDLGVIVQGTLERHWSGIIHAFGAAYWPPVNSGELYRPLTIGLMTVEWQLGGGDPIVFRIATLLVYVAATLAVWHLLRRLTPPTAAWMGAALFAVHPVHVEAVVEAVSQSEVIVAGLLALAVAIHIDANAGRRDVTRAAGLTSLCFASALFFKESAMVLPALLVAADLLVDRAQEPFTARWRRWWRHYVVVALIAASFWITRSLVLGSEKGTHTAEALSGGLVARAWTMLGVPAEWLRLFLWPARLQDEWSPLEWIPTRGWSVRELAGALALGSVLLALVLAWRRRPHLAFGILFTAIALAPVANLLIPTGVVIAERTLFLPSVGFVVVVAALLQELPLSRWASDPVRRRIGAAVFGALLIAGTLRSALRLVDWRTPVIWSVTSLQLAPLSWRTHMTYASRLLDVGDTVDARQQVRIALALRSNEPAVVKLIADYGRLTSGACVGSSLIYEEVLRVAPRRSDARGSLVACLAYLGRYEEARKVAEEGIRLGLDVDFYRVVLARAEQAQRAHTPPGQWRVHLPGSTATDIGPLPPE